MPRERDKASETENPKRPQFTLKVVFISITLISIGLGALRFGAYSSELSVCGVAIIGAGIGIPVGWLRKGHMESAMQWACYGAGAAMLIVGGLPVCTF